MKTYVTDELPLILQNFISDYSKIYRSALVFTVNTRLTSDTSKPDLNPVLQKQFGLMKRHANAVITDADSMIGSAKECRVNHIAQLEGKLKSAKEWLRKKSKSLKDSQKFYRAKNWHSKKSAPNLRLSCYLDSRQTTHQSIKFSIHHKKRYIAHLERQILSLKKALIRVTVNKQGEAYFVGSKGEACGNQIFQFDGLTAKVRVPPCLEEKYGETLECKIEPFPYGQDKLEQVLSTTGFTQNKKTAQQSPIRYGLALTHRFYAQNFR